MEFQILHRHSISFISSKFLGATQRTDVYLVETVTMSALLSTKQLCIQLAFLNSSMWVDFLSVFHFISSHTPPPPPPPTTPPSPFLFFTFLLFFLFLLFFFFLSFFSSFYPTSFFFASFLYLLGRYNFTVPLLHQ